MMKIYAEYGKRNFTYNIALHAYKFGPENLESS